MKSNLYSYDGFYSVINEVLEKQDIKKFYLVGHSMGGMVAWRYSLDRFEQIKGLIIIGSPFIGSEIKNNPRLQVNSAEEYAEIMDNLNLSNPQMMDIAIPANLNGLILKEI